jgi:DNA-binding transcriptional MerR regulator
MGDGAFSIDDLAQLTGLSTRAIRDYIARGLVPPSEGLGRAASYSSEHLNRLLALRALRSRGRGLAEIDSVLSSGDSDAVAALAEEGRAEVEADSLTSPLSYIQSITPLGRSFKRPPPRRISPPAGPMPAGALVTLAELLQQISTGRPAPSARATDWVHVRVTTDFEISVRGPLDAASRLALERAADILRTIVQPNT